MTIAQALTISTAGSGTKSVATITDSAANIAGSSDAVIANSAGAVTANTAATVGQATSIEVFATAVVYALSDASDTIAAEVLAGVAGTNIANATAITHTGVGAATNPAEGVDSLVDTFNFATIAGASIENFEDGTDLIDIATIQSIGALAFEALSDGSGSTSTQILVAESGGNTTLDIDIDDDGVSDMQIVLTGVTGLTIDASDFII